MSKINIMGVNVNYIQEGSGHDVLLLHGWGQNIEMMKPIGDHLKDSFRVTIIDFPGFGASDEPKEVWGDEEYTQMLEILINKLEINKPIIMGHSFGGRQSIVYSSRNEVEKVVLIDSAGIVPKRGFDYYVRVYTYKTLKQVFKLPFMGKYRKKMQAKFGSSDYKNASEMMKKILVKVVNNDLRTLLKNIKAPTLLVWGEIDDATPLNDAKLMEKMIPDAGLVVFNGCGHYSYLDNLPYFKIVIDSFLKANKEG